MTCDREDLIAGWSLIDVSTWNTNRSSGSKEDIDLAVDPPPDLGIEMEITRSFVEPSQHL